SRRRHTRSKRDWSSDVCSSDLLVPVTPTVDLQVCGDEVEGAVLGWADDEGVTHALVSEGRGEYGFAVIEFPPVQGIVSFTERERSEERRVGKACTARGRAERVC